MFLFFIFIALANLALGYLAAVKFHAIVFPCEQQEREIVRSIVNHSHDVPPFSLDASQMPSISGEAPLVVTPPEDVPAAIADDRSAQGETEFPQGSLLSGEMKEPLSQVDLSNDSTDAPVDDSLDESLDEKTRPELAISVDDFMAGLRAFRAQLSELDDRVRECAKSPDTSEIEGCVQEFRNANNRYLEQTTEAADRLQQQTAESAELDPVRAAVQQAIATQTEEVRRAESDLNEIDVAADPIASCERLLRGSQDLSAASEKLGDNLATAQVEICSSTHDEGSLGEDFEPLGLIDDLTQIPSRSAYEVALDERIHAGVTFSVGLIDVDQYAQLIAEHGQETVDSVVKALARVVSASAQGAVQVVRYGGQQFALLDLGSELDDAAEAVESVRQIVEKTHFNHDDNRLEVTVSCAVVTADGNDTTQTIDARLQEALQEAQRFGRNRTFQRIDDENTPVLPPRLDIQANTFEV